MSAQEAALTWPKSKGIASKLPSLQRMCTKCSTNPHTSLITSREDLHLELEGAATNRQGMSPKASQRVVNVCYPIAAHCCSPGAGTGPVLLPRDVHWMVWPSVQDTGNMPVSIIIIISSTPDVSPCQSKSPEKFQQKAQVELDCSLITRNEGTCFDMMVVFQMYKPLYIQDV